MASLSIRLLGSLRVCRDDKPVTGFDSDKVRALLAYLATEPGQAHRRELLAGLLWPDCPERNARASLRGALANLRTVINDAGADPPFLEITWQTIQLNSEADIFCDAATFSCLLQAQGPCREEVQSLERALALYNGPFLDGFDIGSSLPFGEWMQNRREQLQGRAMLALHFLARHYEATSDHESAIYWAWHQIEMEPWREAAHRQLMRLLAADGQRGAALAQYERCRQVLALELEVEPAPETTELYRSIRDGKVPGQDRALSGNGTERERVDRRPRPPIMPFKPTRSERSVPGRLFSLIGLLLLLLLAGEPSLLPALPLPQAAPPLSPRAALSPKSRIVDVCGEIPSPQLCILDVLSGEHTLLVNTAHFRAIIGPSWSPDGKTIVFSAAPDLAEALRPAHNIYLVDLDGSRPRQLTAGDMIDLAPAWSPDGRWVAFHRDGDVWLVAPNGQEPEIQLTHQPDRATSTVAWSPDSHELAFLVARLESPRTADLWAVALDGSQPRKVHTFERQLPNQQIAWSPDGHHLVYVGGEDRQERVVMVDSAGRGSVKELEQIPFWWFANYWPPFEAP